MKRKQKNKKIIVVAIALLLLISIGYAAISTKLTINGTATIAATSWNVHFENVQVKDGSVAVNEGTAVPAVVAGSTDTTTLTYAVTLEKPGDFYEFTVDVVNGGTINAKIAEKAEENGIIKTMKIGDAELTDAQKKLIDYTVTYADASNTEIRVGDKLAKAGTVENGVNTDKKTIKVRVAYKKDLETADLNAVTEDMALTLTFGLNYVQD